MLCLQLTRETCSFIPLACIYFERGREGEGQKPMLTFGERVAITKISLYYSLKNFYGAPITETEHLQVPEHTYKGILTGLNRVCVCVWCISTCVYVYVYVYKNNKEDLRGGWERHRRSWRERGKGGNDRNIALTYEILKIFIYQNIKIIKNVINHLQLIK